MANLLIGRSGNLALYANDSVGVIIDTSVGLVVNSGRALTLFQTSSWSPSKSPLNASETLLGDRALENYIEDALIASADRMFSIPKSVQAEAQRALDWRKEENRGGTSVGLNTARTLAKGGQVGIRKIRHIAKYFPRHEVDKQGKGWKPGQDNFPSNGRIAWALWGGDAGQRWARAIVEREDKKAVTAGAYGFVKPELTPFQEAHMLDENYGPEFLARVDLAGDGIDRLYKIDIDGRVYVWDDECWDDLGSVDGDIWTYDKSLDDPYSKSEKTHIIVDPSSALLIAARLAGDPDKNVSVHDLDADEAIIVALGLMDEDWSMIDMAMTAAGEVAAEAPTAGNDLNGVDTPEERSARASSQGRNALGRFAKVGQRIAVAGDSERGAGTIVSIDAKNGLTDVKLDDGRTITVGIKYTQPLASVKMRGNATRVDNNENMPLDTSGILGEPRTPINQPKAHLKGTLPPMTSEELTTLMTNFPKYVQNMRESYKPLDAADKAQAKKRWGVTKFAETSTITAAGVEEEKLTPETSDIPPKYIAIVSPEAPDAVMDLVAIVPKTATTTAPATYKREDKKWIYDEQIYNDLVSATPPPVIELDKASVQDVISQMDETGEETPETISAGALVASMDAIFMPFFAGAAVTATASEHATEDPCWDGYKQIGFKDKNGRHVPNCVKVTSNITAAGGLDRNRGNAEELRRYWTTGKGAAKIRWGTEGDWKRCVRYLGKYMGVRAKGYCQLRHIEATGVSTGSRFNPGNETAMEEVWGENLGQPTKITNEDMLMPIEDIMSESDDIYDAGWEPEEEVCKQLEVLGNCRDSEYEAITAAGGLDQNRGNAEELRQYWTRGKGAAKIRWGTPGDWTRCVRQLSKYMGARAKGYCQLRHKDATGIYTGSRANPGNDFSVEAFDIAMIEASTLNARANEARERFGLTASAGTTGAKFRIPLVIPENLESGDGRKFKASAIEIRELPLPLMWQIKTGEGHNGSVVVGRIDYMERTENGIGNAYGVFDTGAYGREAERLVRNGFIRGVSADLDQFEAKEEKLEASENAEDGEEVGKSKLTINHARVMAATIVAKPAFQECTILIEDDNTGDQEETMIPDDGIYEELVDPSEALEVLTASGFLDTPIPMTPPQAWFEKPALTKATPLTIDPDGRVYGHIAAWHVNHIGMPRSTRPPRSKSKYAYFHTGVVRTDSGKDMSVGQLTLAGGHASLNANAAAAAKHYDDTASAIADVHAGEDDYGIYVAGCLRPDASEAQIRALRASAPSGDWRPINGQLELVAVCQVNVPGFPIARAMVASGKVMALVAAGAHYMAIMKSEPALKLAATAAMMSELSSYADSANLSIRVKKAKKALKTKQSAQQLTAITASLASMRSATQAALAEAEFAKFSDEERTKLAEKGFALPDGSYPIRNEDDLRNAITAYGRSKPQDRVKVRKHIAKRARALSKAYLIPEEWKTVASAEVETLVASMRSRIATFAGEDVKKISEADLKKLADAKTQADKQTEEEIKIAQDIADGKTTAKEVYDAEGRSKYTPKTQPRDAKGQYRKVLARLKQNLGVAGLQDALKKVTEAENLEFAGDYVKSSEASGQLLDMIDRLDTKALNPQALENIRSTTAELGKTIANLPLPFGSEADKLKFSDLPSGLKDLIDKMITRVEAKIGKEDSDIATADLKSFMSGADFYNQAEIQSQMNKLLRLLT